MEFSPRGRFVRWGIPIMPQPRGGCEFVSKIYCRRLPKVAFRRGGEQHWASSRSAVGAERIAITVIGESSHRPHHRRNCEGDMDLGTACFEEAAASSPGLSAGFRLRPPGFWWIGGLGDWRIPDVAARLIDGTSGMLQETEHPGFHIIFMALSGRRGDHERLLRK